MMGTPCPTCGKIIGHRRGRKGGKPGRPKLRNDDEIKRLRAQGLSIREIAHAIKLSTTAVQRGLK